MIERCSPVEMRKNLETVEAFKRAGLDFVAIPVINNGYWSKEHLMQLQKNQLEDLSSYAEGFAKEFLDTHKANCSK